MLVVFEIGLFVIIDIVFVMFNNFYEIVGFSRLRVIFILS
ncbi:hypothetical protein SDC9_201974 [bioreactor metagenome]|uniref:Uncharacterized protein n=1 Tax=bioreactor metagenome TaxID=1076179 RepID=A0A645J1D1_9ZZZZ